MSRMEFIIVDVFTVGRKYTGNQLAVYLGAPPPALMQQLAKEINFSETTFVTASEPVNGGYDVRIFMPEVEVDFAGHPVLGTAFVIQREYIRKPVSEIRLNLALGQIPVRFAEDGSLWMKQQAPRFGAQFSPAALAPILNLSEDDFDSRYPLQEVSTGLPFVLAPVKNLAALRRARVNLDRLRALLGAHEAIAPAIFCRETMQAENDIHVRVLDDIYGAPEDPATGSANGCIAAYMARYHYLGSGTVKVRSEQGYQIGRPSLLYLQAQAQAADFDIHVGGMVEMVARGQLAADD